MWRIFRRWRSAGRRPLPSRIGVEVREEIRFYLGMRAEELRREGLAPEEAWKKAVEAFGDPEAVAEAVVSQAPEGRRGPLAFLDSLVQDARNGLRALRRAPGFTAAAVLALALGTGATTAIFSVVSGVILRPLPFPEPDRLVAIHSRWTAESGYDWDRYPVGSPEYFDYLTENRSMAAIGAVSTERVAFRPRGGDPRVVTAGVVSPSMFQTLRVPPLLGRTLLEADGGPDPAPVVVLAHDFWLRELGGDSTVVGRTVELGWENRGNKASSVVVGVMPAGFTFPDPDVEMWAPLLLDPARTWRLGHWFSMVARLSPGVSVADAEADMARIMASWRERYPEHHSGHFLYLTPLKSDLVAGARPALLLLLGAVAFVLLIACANVSTLLLARGTARQREIAVRASLGAGRTRLVRQLLTEALLLAALGGVIGLVLAGLGVDALLALEGGTLPRGQEVGIDVRVLGFTALIVILTTLTSGLMPAWEATLAAPGRVFGEGGRGATAGRRRVRLRHSLVVAEVGLALVLLLGAGLMARSFWHTLRQDPGFATEGLLVVSLTFPESGYSAQEKVDLMTTLAERVGQAPGVSEAGVVSRPPLLHDLSMTRFGIEDRPEVGPGEEGPTGSQVIASRSALDALGVRALRGRLFDARDVVDGPAVAIIDETMAERYWPGEDPVGRRIRFGATDSEMRTIVGVVTPVRFDGLTLQAPTFYEPDTQAARMAPVHLGTMTLLVRTVGDPAALAGTVRDAVRALDPALPILSARTMEDIIGGSVARPRFVLALLLVFAILAVTLGTIGVYGVVAQAVSQRTNEIGVRRSLGAGPREVWRMIVGEELRPVATGIALGLGAGLALSRLLAGFLFQVSGTDPVTYGVVALAVATVATLATAVPARRAMRIDPVEALRME